MRQSWALATLALAYADDSATRIRFKSSEEDPFARFNLTQLERAIHVRGLSCEGCSEDAYRKLASANVDLPIDEELAREFDDLATVRRIAAANNISHADFISQMTSNKRALDKKGAQRMYDYFQFQLETGAIRVMDNGTIQFSPPFTHLLAPYTPDRLLDLIEGAIRHSRRIYLRLPHRYRRRVEARLDAFVESGAVFAVITILLTFLVLDFVLELYYGYGRRAHEADAEEKLKAS